MGYYLRYFNLVLGLVVCFCICAKAETPLFIQKDELNRVVYEAFDLGYTIKHVHLKEGHTQVTFSDGSSYSFDIPVLVSIGLDGFCYVNGEKTNHVWSESEQDIRNLFLGENIVNQNDGNVILGLFEGIKTWSFYFEGNSTITFSKTIFSYDPDCIKKGIAHRGYSSLAPENTLPSFRLARLNGFNYVETDIWFTSDGIPVLLHDQTIDRTSNGNGAVSSFSLEQIKQFDFGSWKHPAYTGITIPTLTEFLELCRNMGISPYLELKTGTKSQIEQLIDCISEYGLIDQTTIISFDLNHLRYASNYSPSIRLGYLTTTLTEAKIKQASTLYKDINDIFISASNWPADMVDLCEKSALPLEVWTIDDPLTILLLPDYISGVTSNSLHAGILIHDNH